MSRISPDVPCKGENPEAEDLLGYYPFAKTLADGIYNSQTTDGLVIALYGSWGTGKSTLLNFVEHALNKKDTPMTIVRFNPWWFSGREDLSRDLINQIGIALSPATGLSKKIGGLLHKYAEGIGRITDQIGITAGYGEVFGKFVSKIASPSSVPQLKTEISNLLVENGEKILVLVDDIDRLNPSEIRELFTVIKALADFPNVIYLMAFAKEIVSSALKNEFKYDDNDDGERFLQKIVQVEFEMPLIDMEKISSMLDLRLQEIIEEPLYDEQHQEYWREVYRDLQFFFESPRDVFRFANVISVTFPAVKDLVNPVDFIAIEAIRIFASKLYLMIKDYPNQFTKTEFYLGWQKDLDEEQKKNFEESWINSIPEKIRENIRNLVRTIFPTLSQYTFGVYERKEWANDLRICDPDILPVYFRFSLPDSMVPKSEIQKLFSSSPEEIAHQLLLYKNSSEDKSPQAVEKMSQLLDDIPSQDLHNFVIALLNIGDSLIEKSERIWFFWDVRDLVLEMIQRILPEQKEIITEAIRNSASFTIPILTISGLLFKQSRIQENSETTKAIPNDVINTLIRSIKDKITNKVSNEPYWIPECLPNVLAAWENIGGMAEAKEYCKRHIDSDDHIIAFLRACLTQSQVYGYRSRISPQKKFNFDGKTLYKFFDFKECVDRLKTIEGKIEFSDEDKEILEAMEKFIRSAAKEKST